MVKIGCIEPPTVNDISEYIGYVMGGSKITFIYRIIPEVQGFGLNYEDVGVCGTVGPPKQ